MFSLKRIQAIFLCMVLVLIFGCTIHYVPKQYPINEGAIPYFTLSSPVHVVNDLQGQSRQLVIGTDPYTFVGDLSEYTETAMNLLKSELDKKNIKNSNTAKKIIHLEIIKASLHLRGFINQTYIALKVETGKGYAREYHVINSSGLFDKSIDSTIAKAVTSMLNDQKIIEYLTK